MYLHKTGTRDKYTLHHCGQMGQAAITHVHMTERGKRERGGREGGREGGRKEGREGGKEGERGKLTVKSDMSHHSLHYSVKKPLNSLKSQSISIQSHTPLFHAWPGHEARTSVGGADLVMVGTGAHPLPGDVDFDPGPRDSHVLCHHTDVSQPWGGGEGRGGEGRHRHRTDRRDNFFPFFFFFACH